ncbi:MAG: radical SAM protein [bacterium]
MLKNQIYFFAPSIKKYETDEFSNHKIPLFSCISITGKNCALSCEHCKGKILETMQEVNIPEELYQIGNDLFQKGGTGLLISGGANKDGAVPLIKYTKVMKKLNEEFGLKIVVHTGLVDEKLADALKQANISSAMIDIIGSNETINEVYHLKASIDDYEKSLKLLVERGIEVSPHIIIGLHFGKLLGEEKALEIISRYKINSLVLVIISPFLNTSMENIKLPDLKEVKNFFMKARKMFFNTSILLGCAHSGGIYSKELEKYAVQIGFNGIAYPSEGTIEFAKNQKLKPVFSEYCCSLINQVK